MITPGYMMRSPDRVIACEQGLSCPGGGIFTHGITPIALAIVTGWIGVTPEKAGNFAIANLCWIMGNLHEWMHGASWVEQLRAKIA